MEKQNNDYSATYKRDLALVYNKFICDVPQTVLQQPIESIFEIDFDKFFSQFKSSATHYMNKRRALGVLFSELVRKKYVVSNPIRETSKQKGKAKLHQIYQHKQMLQILDFLKETYPNLYLCCLLAYGCFLRPHQESRLLKVKHISSDFKQIRLSGSENKSKRVRIVNLPIYIQETLKSIIGLNANPEMNIISRTEIPFNVSYFNLQWSRAKIKLKQKGLIQKEQTIYSFRHTGAVNVYRKTKDLNILQQLLGHSNMIVTLKYLRGLGEATNEDLANVLPEL